MSFSVHPITPTFAAEIGDLDLSAPLGDAAFEALDTLMWDGSSYIRVSSVRGSENLNGKPSPIEYPTRTPPTRSNVTNQTFVVFKLAPELAPDE